MARANVQDTVRVGDDGLAGRGVALARFGSIALYGSLALVFLWFGAMKFTDYEAAGIAGFVMNSPIVGWWHLLLGIKGTSLMLGVFEVLTGLLLASRAFSPALSAAGALMSVVTYLITLSFLFTTPGVAEPLAGGFPALSAMPGQFLLKDAVLLAVSIHCLGESLAARGSSALGRDRARLPTRWGAGR
ncbi:MAG: DUF417 family protein [Geminicoccaceae bacterium]|nr:DUF417 family protein [Geminicoccaceae bacterium]